MADENPSSNAEPGKTGDAPIELPPKSDAPNLKRETVRVSIPETDYQPDSPIAKRDTARLSIPDPDDQPSAQAPKKETSKVIVPGSGIMNPPVPRPPGPPIPPPPRAPVTRPLSGATPPPKPPPLSGRPTIPLKPAPPTPASGAVPQPVSGIVAKPASPKKETARISLPSEPPKPGGPALPRATVKMQPTQPLKAQPSGARPQPVVSVTSSGGQTVMSASPASPDKATLVLSILAFVGAVAALVFAVLVYKAAELPKWVLE